MGKSQRVRRLSLEQEETFPMLVIFGYEVASEATTQYNCIAHAADDHTTKWGCPPYPVSTFGHLGPNKAMAWMH